MMKKSDLLINTNGYVLSLLEKVLDANIEVKGRENIPKNNPRIFIANHFTRTEAMLVPYSLFNITGKKVGVIADESLFKSYFGSFLENLGAMSTTNPNRNNHIIGDLITSCKDWMIFPEGRMVKAKDITKIDNNFCVKIDNVCQRVYTGASFFALSSQILRQNYFNHKIKDSKKFQRKYFVNECSDIKKEETMIVPINISYSKLRTGRNFLLDMAEKLVSQMGDNFKEEIEIESNIILNSKITIQILKPISTKDILKEYYEKQVNQKTIIDSLRYQVTHELMNKIYESLTINFDHIFILVLSLYPKEQLDLNHFKRLIYLTIEKIKKEILYLDEEIDKDLIYLISYEKYKKFEEVLELAIKDNIIKIQNDLYFIEKKILLNSHTHHTIRLKNILKVILNEIQINEKVTNIVKTLCNKKNDEIDLELLLLLIEEEKQEFEQDYKIASNNKDLKAKDIGQAFHLFNKDSNTCVITIHGFSSTPKEVEQLAKFLNTKDLNAYAPRLAGHGTIPEDLKNTLWQDWYKSVSRAITIASLQYEKVYVLGFSTGGLLALLSTKKCFVEFQGIICINAALHLNDIRIKTLLPALSFWNDIVKAFNEDEYAKEYVENIAENPEINYDKFYIDAIEQLNILMHKTKKNLEKIKSPILIIQSKDDPVVNPSSAYEIYEKIQSENKTIKIIDSSKHVIIKGKKTKELYNLIYKFINKN
ncbi:alpha/beta fold hydrolase [Poseidonibacter ostreae]|jgi:esterase/lipase/1-acyl-sn-glycerol-3-phosphate acyltransferase|uniref:Prolyl oligopeptidase family serine peptidase n=1 Tax=Poseidonibacter ostreae TaxID=2654171 RepID=A0A6L4WPJ6_9BACT|nr:alpha/beta fold hydrolase [Poseidonibacter ostreae]KAB7884367.1 prolyl oligopeptidase family serine peptidase [Poseidonibacter ostreae]KAB7885287.1 prolyl oligopeptidase family serine peptidase [Poseidonibacter ostreae]KAB7891741.1 prolyl oligopeptidase family serine peptidase [Poseidonibacter ostreae]